MPQFLTDFWKTLTGPAKPENAIFTTGITSVQAPSPQNLIKLPSITPPGERAGLSGGFIPGSILASGPLAGVSQKELGARPEDVTQIETMFGPQPIPRKGAEVFEISRPSLGLRDFAPGGQGFLPNIRPAVPSPIPQQPAPPGGPTPSGPTPSNIGTGPFQQRDLGIALSAARGPINIGGSFIGGSALGQFPGGEPGVSRGFLGNIGLAPQTIPGAGAALTPEQEEEERRRQALIAQQQRIVPPAGERPFTVPVPTGEIQVPTVPAPQLQRLLTEESAQSFSKALDLINQEALRIKGELDRMNPTPAEPVVPTPEQQAAEQANPEMKTIGDQMRRQFGLPGFESQRIEQMKIIQATQQTFAAAIQQIEANPNLPKSLAARRIAELNKELNLIIKNAQGNILILNQQIDDINDEINRQLGYEKDERAEQERKTDNSRQVVNQLTTSGALAGLTQQQLRQLEKEGGFPTNSLNAVQQALNDKKASADEARANARRRLELAEERADAGTAADRKAAAAINIYKQDIQDYINQGASPEQALAAVNRVAAAQGITLDIETQNALLNNAKTLTAAPAAAAPEEATTRGNFFSNIISRFLTPQTEGQPSQLGGEQVGKL